MDLRLKLMAFLFLVLLLVMAAMYFLTGEIFAPWFVVILVFFFAIFFALRIAQKRRRI